MLFLVSLALTGGLDAYALGCVTAAERVARALAILWNAALNLLLWSRLLPAYGPALGAVLALVGLGSLTPLARHRAYHAALGWASWLMPMTWPALGLGFVTFVAARAWRRGLRTRLDRATGTLETSGLPPFRGFRGGFNLGPLTFLLGVPATPFPEIGISAHEAGHSLNVAAFGSVWHLGNGIEQNLRPWARGADAYGELLAEGYRPDGRSPWIPHWS